MSATWGDLVSRVRGLSGHLLGRAQLTSLARSRDLIQLAAALDEAYGPAAGVIQGTSAEQLELAARRAAALYLRVVARWSGDRARYLAPLFLDEDRRSIRSIVRGVLVGAPVNERLAGLIPTPALPERALEELARQPSARDVVALLVLWGHPFGKPLLAEARQAKPDLFRLDLTLNSEYATRSLDAARRAPLGDAVRRDLTMLVRETIDLENASTALQLAGQKASTEPGKLFIPGGKRLDRATFLAAAASDSAAATDKLAHVFQGTPLASVFAVPLRTSFEDAALAAELRWTSDAARQHPLGAAPLIQFLTRVRAELRDLRFIIWRVALDAPPAPPDALVTIV